MSQDVDGNVYFLDKYLNDLDKSEEYEYGGVEVEFSGEELYDYFSKGGFKEALPKLKELHEEYPHNDFGECIRIVVKYLKLKEERDAVSYAGFIAREYFSNLSHWIDTKWLALGGKEDEILESILEVSDDIVYDTDVITEIDFVELTLLGWELESLYSEFSGEAEKQLNRIIYQERAKVAVVGLVHSGITKDFIFNNSPSVVAKRVLTNKKTITKTSKKLLVSDEQALRAYETLGLVDSGVSDELNDCRIYSNVYKLFIRPATSKKFGGVVRRVEEELRKRLSSGEDIKFYNYTFKDSGLVIYVTKRAFLVIGTRISLYQRINQDAKSLVLCKSIHDVRVSDIKCLVSKI